MSLFVEAVEVDEVVDVGLDVVVGLVGTLPMMRIRFLALELLTIQVLLKKEMLGSLLKDVGTVDHEVLIVVGAVEVLAMVKVVKVKKDALEEHLIVAVGRAEGDVTIDNKSYFDLCFVSTDVFWSTCRNEFKREGAGRGNWGTQSDDITQ